MGCDGERPAVSRGTRARRGRSQIAPGRRHAMGRRPRAGVPRSPRRRPDPTRDGIAARSDRMKRASWRAVVQHLARSDLKGRQRSRALAGVTIRDGDLAVALTRNELLLHYQPIVDLRSSECRRVEALLRWRHPRLGLLEPADFLPIASEFIAQIGAWVVRAAALQWTEWRAGGPALGIGINVSGPELANIDALL